MMGQRGLSKILQVVSNIHGASTPAPLCVLPTALPPTHPEKYSHVSYKHRMHHAAPYILFVLVTTLLPSHISSSVSVTRSLFWLVLFELSAVPNSAFSGWPLLLILQRTLRIKGTGGPGLIIWSAQMMLDVRSVILGNIGNIETTNTWNGITLPQGFHSTLVCMFSGCGDWPSITLNFPCSPPLPSSLEHPPVAYPSLFRYRVKDDQLLISNPLKGEAPRTLRTTWMWSMCDKTPVLCSCCLLLSLPPDTGEEGFVSHSTRVRPALPQGHLSDPKIITKKVGDFSLYSSVSFQCETNLIFHIILARR